MKVTAALEHHTRTVIGELRDALDAPVPQRPEWIDLDAWTLARHRAALHGEHVPAEILLAIPAIANEAEQEAAGRTRRSRNAA